MVTLTAHDNLVLTGVRAHSIYAVKASHTWFSHTAAFINVYNKVIKQRQIKQKSNFSKVCLLNGIVICIFQICKQ